MIKKIDLIDPYSSQYGALHHFTRKLYEAWLRAGYQARYFEKAELALEAALNDPPDLLIGFNGIPRKDKLFYCDLIKRPYLTLLVDPFFRFLDVTASPYAIVGCDDFSGVLALQRRQEFHRTLFVPHAVESDLELDPRLKRIYDVTMLATFIDHEARRREWKSKYPLLVCKMMDEAVEMTFADPLLPFFDAILSKIQQGFQENPELKNIIKDPLEIFRDVEVYIKGKERVDILKAIRTNTVHVFGHSTDPLDWKKYFENQNNIIIHEAVPYEESLKILKQSKITLNGSIKNKFGAHERIFAGLAAGALVFTNENAYLKKYFMHDIDIGFYQFAQLHQLDAMVAGYLSDQDKRQQVVENGREIVMSYHTWDARIKSFEEELFPMAERIL